MGLVCKTTQADIGPYLMSLCISSFCKFRVLAIHCNLFPWRRGHGAVTPCLLGAGLLPAGPVTCKAGQVAQRAAWTPPCHSSQSSEEQREPAQPQPCAVWSHISGFISWGVKLQCKQLHQVVAAIVTVTLKLCHCDSSVTVTLFSCGTMNWCWGSQGRSTCRWTNPQDE